MTADDWWRTFFDDEYVRLWQASGAFDRTAEDVEGIVALLDGAPGREVLDVGCGFGRVAGVLHERGYRVTGLDVSEPQLRLARERNPGPRYVQGDMREPPPGPFDAVLNVYSAFGYFADRADDVAALRAWHEVLRPGGVLVMDLAHRDALARLWQGDDQVVDHGGIRETGVTDWLTGRRTATVTAGDVTKTFALRLYTATELHTELRAAGFAAVEAFGDLAARTPLSPATRLVLRATR